MGTMLGGIGVNGVGGYILTVTNQDLGIVQLPVQLFRDPQPPLCLWDKKFLPDVPVCGGVFNMGDHT